MIGDLVVLGSVANLVKRLHTGDHWSDTNPNCRHQSFVRPGLTDIDTAKRIELSAGLLLSLKYVDYLYILHTPRLL